MTGLNQYWMRLQQKVPYDCCGGEFIFAAHPLLKLSPSLDVSLLMATSNIYGAIKESCNKS